MIRYIEAAAGMVRRARRYARSVHMARERGLRTRPACRAVIGSRPCCCGNPACPELPTPQHCWRRISVLRLVVHGTCAEHDGYRRRS